MAYGNWNNRNSGGNTLMQNAYGDFGSAINGTGITQNYYDAVAKYREAQRQAFANMAQVLKDNADKQSMTSSPSVIAQPRNMGNIGKLNGNVPYGPNIPSLANAITPKTPEISGPVNVTMNGSGGTQIQDVPMINYYNDQLQSYAGTKKGMADFMNELMAVEANQGTKMDMTGSFAMQDPNEVRRTNPTGIPSMQNLLTMPEDINKQRINLQNEALSKEDLYNSQRAEQTISELIAKYPQAHAALQNGTLTIDANGAFKYNNEKSPGVSADARNEIAKFIGETGTLGKYYTAPIDKGGQGFKREYNAIYSPEAQNQERQSTKEYPTESSYITFPDEKGGQGSPLNFTVYKDHPNLIANSPSIETYKIKVYDKQNKTNSTWRLNSNGSYDEYDANGKKTGKQSSADAMWSQLTDNTEGLGNPNNYSVTTERDNSSFKYNRGTQLAEAQTAAKINYGLSYYGRKKDYWGGFNAANRIKTGKNAEGTNADQPGTEVTRTYGPTGTTEQYKYKR